MPQPRHQLVNLEATPFYHVHSRCVRQQFLCGFDRQTGRDFSHRRDWIKRRIRKVASAFAIHVYAYAVMSNHFHLVVAVDQSALEGWSDLEVARRWRILFKGPELLQRFTRGKPLSASEVFRVRQMIARLRSQLADLSWFMRAINEPIARMANTEDNVSGHFWEGRFKSQACKEPLLPVFGPPTDSVPRAPRFGLSDYLALVDWSGRAVCGDKPGTIPSGLPSLFDRININPTGFVAFIRHEERGFYNAIGPSTALRNAAQVVGQRFFHGQNAARRLFQAS
jgi:REP element-mobilizing transposase RayT